MEGIDWAKDFFFNLYTTSSEGMYSTDNLSWETASVHRVSAEIDMGMQGNNLKT